MEILYFFSAWMFFGFIGCLIGTLRDRRTQGLFLGLLLGPIGWVMALYDAGLRAGMLVFLIFIGVALAAMKSEQLDREKLRAIQDPEARQDLVAAPESTPAPTPVNFFPDIRTKSGYTLRNVVVTRWDVDGFVVNASGKVTKLWRNDLPADIVTAFENAGAARAVDRQ